MRIALLVLLLSGCSSKVDLPVFGNIPDFTLTERSNRTVQREDLAGSIWVADFIFTRCGGICPVMSANMRKLQDMLPADVRFLSFSVDPEYDTPAVLADYADRFGADRDRWLFLTGDQQALYKLSSEGFKLAVANDGSEAEPITHSSRFVLIDREGQIRGYYGMDDKGSLGRLAEDARQLF